MTAFFLPVSLSSPPVALAQIELPLVEPTANQIAAAVPAGIEQV